MNTTTGKINGAMIPCPNSLEHANFLTSYKVHFTTQDELKKHGGVCAACFQKFKSHNHRLDGTETPVKISTDHHRPDPEFDYVGFSELGQHEKTVDFDWRTVNEACGAVKASPDDARAQAAELFARLMQWIWDGNKVSLHRATVRLAVLTAGVKPQLIGDFTYAEIAAQTGLTKQAVNKTAKKFERAFNFKFSRSRPKLSCERMRDRAIGHAPTNVKK
jgi:hypothetical protein